MYPAGRQPLSVAKHHLGPSDPACRKLGYCASLYKPAAMHPDEKARFNALGELLD
jgi:hypothetical protein